ncbi:hypothetical protein VTL71DRAFT_6243 [Oculimacula yallundae]|uniref:MSP domain-containing protein n=1 Tax=Oculimacula yallundae TaxID=86028 RepID=A0ABR4C0Y2_9HELO
MDHIALATTISSLTGVSLKAAASLDALKLKFTNQARAIEPMYSECSAISASLTQVQSSILQGANQSRVIQVQETFDTIITGCRVLFACLEHDLDSLSTSAAPVKFWKSWGPAKKVAVEWDEMKMQSYLADLKMQQGALVLLNELISINALELFHIKRRNNISTVQQQALATRKLRAANPGLDIPASIFGTAARNKLLEKPVSEKNYDQKFATNDLMDNTSAYGRSLGSASPTASHGQSSKSVEPISGLMDAKQEKEALGARDDEAEESPDDLLPQYTPYPENTSSKPEPGRAQNDPDLKSNSPSYGITRKNDRIPPTHVPGGPEGLPLEATPSLLTYTLPIGDKQSTTVTLQNPNVGSVHFRVRTTVPTLYCVRPNDGIIKAGAMMQVRFIAYAKTELDLESVNTHKFAIDSIVLAEEEKFDWHRDGGRRAAKIQRTKLKVKFNGKE